VKASPLASILMFVGAAFLLFAAFSTGWFTHSTEDNSMAFGLVRSEVCFDGRCQSGTVFSGGGGGRGIDFLIVIATFLFSFTAVILGIIAGVKLLKPVRTVLAVLVLSFAGAAALFVIILLVKAGGGGGVKFGYAFYMFWLGAASAITASIMAMMRPRAPMQMRPGMPGMPGMYGMPGQHPGMRPGMPQPMYGQPPQQGYAPPGMQPQPQPMQPQAPMPAAQGAPCPTCQTPTMWVAQYNRWFCQRCNQYP
jgi:hypothetical protein